MSESTPFVVSNPDIPFEAIKSQKNLCLCAEEDILKMTNYATYHKGLRGVSRDLYLTNLRIVACGNMAGWMKIAISPALAIIGANKAPKISCQILLNDIDYIKVKRQLLKGVETVQNLTKL